jgi:hypothetical protein
MNRLGTRSTGLLCALVMLLGSAVTAVPAVAAGNAIITDCQSHGQLTKTYSLAALRHALNVLPASVKEYTNCSDVLQQAILVARHGHGGAGLTTTSGSSGGSFLPTPVIIILVVLILAAVTFGALAIRRRRAAGNPEPVPGPGADGSGSDTAPTRLMPSPPVSGDDPNRTRVMPPPDPPDDDDRPPRS